MPSQNTSPNPWVQNILLKGPQPFAPGAKGSKRMSLPFHTKPWPSCSGSVDFNSASMIRGSSSANGPVVFQFSPPTKQTPNKNKQNNHTSSPSHPTAPLAPSCYLHIELLRLFSTVEAYHVQINPGLRLCWLCFSPKIFGLFVLCACCFVDWRGWLSLFFLLIHAFFLFFFGG